MTPQEHMDPAARDLMMYAHHDMMMQVEADPHPLRPQLITFLEEVVAIVAASLHSPELMSEFLELHAGATRLPLEDFSRRLAVVLKADHGADMHARDAQHGQGDDDTGEDSEDAFCESDELSMYRQAIMGNPMANPMMATGQFEGRGGLFNASSHLLEVFFNEFPEVEQFFVDAMFAADSAPVAAASTSPPPAADDAPAGSVRSDNDSLATPASLSSDALVMPPLTITARALRSANKKWLARYPPDADARPHPSERPVIDTAADEEKLRKILVLNLQLHAPGENWAALLDLRDKLVEELTVFLTTGGQQLAGRLQNNVWMLQNTILTLSPSCTTYEIWQRVSSRLEQCMRQTETFMTTLESERKKRYSGGNIWNRLIGSIKKGRPNSNTKACDDAFDKVSDAHSKQAAALLKIIGGYYDACERLRPPTPPDPPLPPPA